MPFKINIFKYDDDRQNGVGKLNLPFLQKKKKKGTRNKLALLNLLVNGKKLKKLRITL